LKYETIFASSVWTRSGLVLIFSIVKSDVTMPVICFFFQSVSFGNVIPTFRVDSLSSHEDMVVYLRVGPNGLVQKPIEYYCVCKHSPLLLTMRGQLPLFIHSLCSASFRVFRCLIHDLGNCTWVSVYSLPFCRVQKIKAWQSESGNMTISNEHCMVIIWNVTCLLTDERSENIHKCFLVHITNHKGQRTANLPEETVSS